MSTSMPTSGMTYGVLQASGVGLPASSASRASRPTRCRYRCSGIRLGNQPSPNGGGWLGSWLGGTPTYKNVDKRPSAAAMTTNANATQAAPASGDVAVSMTTVEPNDACGHGPIAIVIPREVIEQQ